MKYIILILAISLAACSVLKNPQEQPVNKFNETGLYVTTCSGMAETIGSCYEKAKRTCSGSYEVVKEVRDSSGVHRELTFQCKK